MKMKTIAFVEKEYICWDLSKNYGHNIDTYRLLLQFPNGNVCSKIYTNKEKIEYRKLNIIPMPRMRVSVNNKGYFEIEETLIKTINVKDDSYYSFLNDIDENVDAICVYKTFISISFIDYMLYFTHELCRDKHMYETTYPKTFEEWEEDITLLDSLSEKSEEEKESYKSRRSILKPGGSYTGFPSIDLFSGDNSFSGLDPNLFAERIPQDRRFMKDFIPKER